MTHRIALTTLAAVIRTAKRDPYAAVTRPDAPVRPHQPSFAYRLASLARRSAFARRLSGPEVAMGSRKTPRAPSTVEAVEQLATRLWKRANERGTSHDEWKTVQNHLWGVADGLYLCGRTTAAELANDLGFLANRLASLELEAA